MDRFDIEVDVGGATRRLHCREAGRGFPLLFLHSGWGYGVYPFDRQIDALADRYRVILPDRTGYGGSPRRTRFPRDFHQDAAREMTALLDALGVDRATLWGHSDGAISAVWMALDDPARHPALVLEAIHYDRAKPASRSFFEDMVARPEAFGDRVAARLREDHGEGWRDVLRAEGEAWLDILDHADDPARDLYGSRLGELASPALLLHGKHDPRTEPGELEAVHAALSHSELAWIEGGGHSPHTERRVAEIATARAAAFLDAHVAG